MTTHVLLELSDETYLRAANLANLTRQNVKELLADAISGSLPSWKPLTEISPTVDSLADDEVLALTQLALEPNTDARLILLLDRQQSDEITDAEREELDQLMQQYQEGLLRKAQALSEAVKRGLQKPLSP
ncbi:MAG: hypothetical protein R2932_37665 [Caldilineaceae bacterium]